ncbi:MAG: D-alanyl-D-alanine carboxypeptidase/D-alanyl-D-alanine-endopeptidase [Bacteroidia bacterium]|nr:D-alanyl-D-alanine carboxypeptidase/D-alanyl-D-alanine-endopeptidase [Bacteroidia bacterium]MDW8345905.1 D-alanyl-D-alanine carboxypeptidase/D-alanyl-D-alanine-endopeptidase [Bacteroidia bacterium]
MQIQVRASHYCLIIAIYLFIALPTFAQIADSVSNREIKKQQLKKGIEQKLKTLRTLNPKGTFGIKVYSLTHKEILYELNSWKLFKPASNLKVLTSACAITYLGKDFCFKTPILIEGYIKDSVLYGNLIIVGSGDPSFSGRLYDNNPFAVFEQWADTLKAKGIFCINGSVIADDSLIDLQFPSPDRDYSEFAHEWWNTENTAFSFNDNQVTIRITPTQINKYAYIETYPKTNHVLIQNECLTTGGKWASIKVSRKQNSYKFVIKGSIGILHGKYEEDFAVCNPTQYFLDALVDTWQKKGIKIKGYAIPKYQIADFSKSNCDTLFVHTSKNIFELLYPVNNNSNNMYADAFFLKVGAELGGVGNYSNSMICFRYFLEQVAGTCYFDLADGSGLSHCNKITPDLMIKVLEFMYSKPYFEDYLKTFSIPGVCGTAYERLYSPYLNGHTYAKTGSIYGVEAFSGYYHSPKTGEWIAFSYLGNELTQKKASLPHERDLIEWIAKVF